MTLTGWFEKLIVEHGSSVVQGKWIDLLKARLVEIEKDYGNLQKENSRLLEENADLLSQIESYRASEKYTERLGAAFKMDTEGGYTSETVYCPVCHVTMSPAHIGGGYRCTKCGHRSELQRHQVHKVISEINSSKESKVA